jgi:hypothetical protein
MFLTPACKAHIAKLMGASTGNMIASFVLLNEHAAIWASFPIFKVSLKIIVTLSFMFFQHAFRTKLSLTKIAFKELLGVNQSFTVFCWAKF